MDSDLARQRTEFLVLGPLELRQGGRLVPLGPPRVRVVLALLLISRNSVVSVERFIDELWPARPPAGPRPLIHDYLARLRRVLAHESARLVTRRPGYLLRVADEELDLGRYERLLARARTAAAAGRLHDGLARYRESERLWRAHPYADVPATSAIRAIAASVTEQRLNALEELYEIALRLDTGPRVIPDLRLTVAAHPHRERLAGLLMRAQYRAGHTAEALATYHATRRRLADDLGLDPGPELRALERAILRGEPTRRPADRPCACHQDRPAQLPSDVGGFVGRKIELDRIRSAYRGGSGGAIVHTIDGMPGVGKTALAIRAAHELSGQFPGGQLFLCLNGSVRDTTPMSAADALDRLLRALGVPAAQIPAGLDQRAALYRSRLAGQRVLVVLDDAACEQQVIPLLPGAAQCGLLLTSRRQLTGLDTVRPVTLDPLASTEACTLFTVIAGAARLAGEPPDHVDQVVELCGRLPLALRIAASRLRSRPTWTVGYLAQRLHDERDRLTVLEAGQLSVASALDLAYQRLTPDQQVIYRALGRYPGEDFDAGTIARLTHDDVARVGRLLDQLVDVHLLLEPSAGRFAFHVLTRLHAAATAARHPRTAGYGQRCPLAGQPAARETSSANSPT